MMNVVARRRLNKYKTKQNDENDEGMWKSLYCLCDEVNVFENVRCSRMMWPDLMASVPRERYNRLIT